MQRSASRVLHADEREPRSHRGEPAREAVIEIELVEADEGGRPIGRQRVAEGRPREAPSRRRRLPRRTPGPFLPRGRACRRRGRGRAPHAVPRVGCPANGSSRSGVKMRSARLAVPLLEDERRLREVHFPGDGLHRGRVEVGAIAHHRELVCRRAPAPRTRRRWSSAWPHSRLLLPLRSFPARGLARS